MRLLSILVVLLLVACKNDDEPGVQFLLDAGAKPIDLYHQGICLDSIYGKEYDGGLIFYIDVLNEYPWDGLVAATEDQEAVAEWGCWGTNLPIADAAGPQEEGAKLGDGLSNTIVLGNECSDQNFAAKICSDLELNGHDDWFLPSIKELEYMYFNIGPPRGNVGCFQYDYYWSSSEKDDLLSWFYDFQISDPLFFNKFGTNRVRAVRAFKY